MKTRMISAAVVALCVMSAQSAFARGGAMVCHTDAIPLTLTDFNLTLSVPLFDPNDTYANGTNHTGHLTSVSLWLGAELRGDVALTNLVNSPISMIGALAANVGVQRPDLSPLLSVILNAPFGPTQVDGMDTLIVGPLVDTDTTWAKLTAAPDLALFTGPGTLTLPVVGTGSFFAEGGGGNVVSIASTSAAASLDVCYHFSSAPEPGSLGLLLLGMVGLTRRQRQRMQSGC